MGKEMLKELSIILVDKLNIKEGINLVQGMEMVKNMNWMEI